MSEAARQSEKLYAAFADRAAGGRRCLGRPLTLAEKILFAHLADAGGPAPERKKTTVDLRPDRVAMQDATAQMAILQFMCSGMKTTAVPVTIHCDHLVVARRGAAPDLAAAMAENDEVYRFLASAAAKYGMGFWKPGSGIIHQVVLENYAVPGGLMIGTDSHTPNAGGLGMMASGVGGADAVDVMVGEPWGLLWPGAIGVRLTGTLSGWASAKDVILTLMDVLKVDGGTNSAVEFFGPGAETISATGKATICNMGAEHGATASIFPYDRRMADYLRATGRADAADLADRNAANLRADPEVIRSPEKFYDRVIDIDLSRVEPMVSGPHTPDRVRPVSRMKEAAAKEGWPAEVSCVLIGSCTNSSYEDMGRAAAVARDAAARGLKPKCPLLVSPGSDQVAATMARDGLMEAFQAMGATVLANVCGPCIGQWKREDSSAGKKNSIVNTYNRNFARRNDGSADTYSFIAGPELAVAMAFAGRLDFNPATDDLATEDGRRVRLAPPSGDELPRRGFASSGGGFQAPPADGSAVRVDVPAGSKRLQLLEPFPAWDGRDWIDLPVLLKAKGKCTTDHISPAGPWLRFRGHLDAISDNLFLGAVNAFTGEAGKGMNVLTGERGLAYAAVARDYKRRGLGWAAVGGDNYGEGSSREHAAMSPRHLGCRTVIARSFARIHETNLKKQGVLPLTFADAADYDKVREDDRVSILGLADLAAGKPIAGRLRHADGSIDGIWLRQTLTAPQIEWFRAGGALNKIRAEIGK
jgi:aconitate hydratase